MPLLKDDRFVTDAWTYLQDTDEPSGLNAAILPLARLQQQWVDVAGKIKQIGTAIANTTKLGEFRNILPRLQLIALPFPAFTDGRSYSLARQIRQEGFAGELRATGNILPDQVHLMKQVGVDAFEVSERFPLETWQKHLALKGPAYQRNLSTASTSPDVWSVRHHGFEPWTEQPHAG